jgi:hypothetical protein
VESECGRSFIGCDVRALEPGLERASREQTVAEGYRGTAGEEEGSMSVTADSALCISRMDGAKDTPVRSANQSGHEGFFERGKAA